MSVTIQIIILALSLGREFMKFLVAKEQTKHDALMKGKEMRDNFRKANKEGNTDELEKSFSNFNFPKPD